MSKSDRSPRSHTPRIVSAMSHLGLVAAMGAGALASVACTKSDGSDAPAPAPAPATAPAPRVLQNDAVRGQRTQKDAEFEALQKRLAALEGKANNRTSSEVRVSGDVTLPSSVLNEEFLWSSSLQYAKAANRMTGELEVSTVFSLSTKVSRLVRRGDKLLLLSRDSVDAESDYPAENVLAQFSILPSANESLSLKPDTLGLESGRVIGEWLGATPEQSASVFVRSMEFDKTSGALVFELTMRDVFGSQFDFIETVQPRARVVGGAPGLEIVEPEPGRQEDPTHFPTLLKRLGTFPVSAWFAPEPEQPDDFGALAKVQKSHVSRFNIEGGRTIDWYVTANTPDTLMPEIKAGVEGWNRYFDSFRKDQVVVFKGKLPSNVKVGDARYNVILFDAVADSPAAYESQASDPLTGFQTHSLIYLPLAWYNISDARYLDGADDSKSARARGNRDAFVAKLHEKGVIRCDRPGVDMRDAVFMVNSRAATTADEAGRALIRSTLLHEVGHALGMQHNFKGTLTGDVSKYNETDWVYSSSTMDYNPFAMEDTLFTDLSIPSRDVTKGLRQPYDAQFIDVVYNGGARTMAEREKAYPFCDDKDADDTLGGVDPLCTRYDFFASPDQALKVPSERLSSKETYLPRKLGGFVTLSGWLAERSDKSLADVAAASSDEPEAQATLVREAASKYTSEIATAFRHFLRTGSYSYVNALARSMRMLGEWKPVDGIEKDTEFSWRSGLEYASRFITNLFSTDGMISGDAYKSYERKIQGQLARDMADLFTTGLDANGKGFVGEGDVRAAVAAAKDSQSKHFAKLIAALPEAQRGAVGESLAEFAIALDATLEADLAVASARVLQELPTVVVTDDIDGDGYGDEVSSRPAIRGGTSHRLAMATARLASRPTVDIRTRQAAIDRFLVDDDNASRFATNFKVDVEKDGRVVKVLAATLRAEARKELVAQLESERAPLAEKVRKNRYLTAEERTLHEWLSKAIPMVFVEG